MLSFLVCLSDIYCYQEQTWSSNRGVHAVLCWLLCGYLCLGNWRSSQWQYHDQGNRTGTILSITNVIHGLEIYHKGGIKYEVWNVGTLNLMLNLTSLALCFIMSFCSRKLSTEINIIGFGCWFLKRSNYFSLWNVNGTSRFSITQKL